MRRNWELVRKILITVANLPAGQHVDTDGFVGYEDEPELVAYHVKIMHEARLLDVIKTGTQMGDSYFATGLTWEGTEFLDKIESEPAWTRVKAGAAEKGLALSFEVIKAIAVNYIKQSLPGAR